MALEAETAFLVSRYGSWRNGHTASISYGGVWWVATEVATRCDELRAGWYIGMRCDIWEIRKPLDEFARVYTGFGRRFLARGLDSA